MSRLFSSFIDKNNFGNAKLILLYSDFKHYIRSIMPVHRLGKLAGIIKSLTDIFHEPAIGSVENTFFLEVFAVFQKCNERTLVHRFLK